MLPTLYDTSNREIRLLHPLGRGGFGAVFLADVLSGDGLIQRMAVKIIDDKFVSDASIVARARDEARLMSQLNHDHVVKVHGLTEIGRRVVVLMEYVEGIDCAALLAVSKSVGDGGLPVGIACIITERTAAALNAAWHTLSPQTNQPLRVVHRDIKPPNVLLSVGGMVKVMDFGVARADFDREAKSTVMMFGTERYMAPERFIQGTSGPESDIYSLGVTFWELLTGRRFERLAMKQDNFELQLQAHLDVLDDFPDLTPFHDEVVPLLRRMLAFDPAERPTARQVEDCLVMVGERWKGVPLRKYAHLIVPPQIATRRRRLLEDPELQITITALARDPAATTRRTPGAAPAPRSERPAPAPVEPPRRERAQPLALVPALTQHVAHEPASASEPLDPDAPPTTFEPRVIRPPEPPPRRAAAPKAPTTPPRREQIPPVVLPDEPISRQLQRVRERRGDPMLGLAAAGFASVILVAALIRIVWLLVNPLPQPLAPSGAPSVIEANP